MSRRYRRVEPVAFNHGLHFFMDVITCGTWIPVHAGLWFLHVAGVL